MSYKYRALVVDDEMQIGVYFNSVRKHLEALHNLEVSFDVINNDSQYDSNKAYDILLVDYDLKKGFSDKMLGDDFIRKFRELNKVSKILFYSSSFIYRPTERNFSIKFSHKDVFDLINELEVDRIVDRNNFEMMIQMIKECCEQMDLIPIVLSKMLTSYENEDIGVSYLDSQGKEMHAKKLLQEILNDTEEGKRFRKSIIDTLFSVLLTYKY